MIHVPWPSALIWTIQRYYEWGQNWKNGDFCGKKSVFSNLHLLKGLNGVWAVVELGLHRPWPSGPIMTIQRYYLWGQSKKDGHFCEKKIGLSKAISLTNVFMGYDRFWDGTWWTLAVWAHPEYPEVLLVRSKMKKWRYLLKKYRFFQSRIFWKIFMRCDRFWGWDLIYFTSEIDIFGTLTPQ